MKFALWNYGKKHLNNEFTKPTKKDSNDIALILQSLGGWERETKSIRTSDYGIQRVWKKQKQKKNQQKLTLIITMICSNL